MLHVEPHIMLPEFVIKAKQKGRSDHHFHCHQHCLSTTTATPAAAANICLLFPISLKQIPSAADPAASIRDLSLVPDRYDRRPLRFSADAGSSADHRLQSIPHLTARDRASMRVPRQAWIWHQRRLQKV